MAVEIRDEELLGSTVLEVNQRRWHVAIKFALADGREQTMIASADSMFTDGSGVWWGTAEEHEEVVYG